MLPSKKLLNLKPNIGKQLISVAGYSRKSDSKNMGYYKIVKSNDVIDDVADSRFEAVPNWELLGPKSYRFVLPGSIGPAWHEAGSMVPVHNFHKSEPSFKKLDFEELDCEAQECPVLLRKSVLELFPNNEVYTSQQLTIVTLSLKVESEWTLNELNSEYAAKSFIWAAQEICMKLKATGYWADFINPFSGRPYISPFYKPTLYETDERFRCIGFEIKKKGNCKVIQCMKDEMFGGSLFTNAPASTELFYVLLRRE